MSRKNISNENKNIVRMEKKATNHFGLFLLLLIVIGGGGFGAYYLYQHRHEFSWDFTLPWNKDEESKEKESTSSSKKGNGALIVPRLKRTEISNIQDSLTITNITANDKGYEITLSAIANSANSVIFSSEKILVDGYNTTAEFEISDISEDRYSEDIPTEETFRIDKTELDALGIESFKYLVFYYRIKTPDGTSRVYRTRLDAYNDFNFDNSRKGLIKMDVKNETIISYYQTIEDSENTYIYFDFKNEDQLNVEYVRIKKLLINGEMYNYSNFNEQVYSGSETIVYLKIPKKEIKEVKNFTISFILTEEYEEEDKQDVYITTEFYKELE